MNNKLTPKEAQQLHYPIGKDGIKSAGTAIINPDGTKGTFVETGPIMMHYDTLYDIKIRSDIIGQLYEMLQCRNVCLPKVGFSNFQTAVLEPVKSNAMNLAQRLRQGNLKLR